MATILVQSRFDWKPNLSFPKSKNGYLLRRLLHTKLEMRSGQLHSCQMERLVRAPGAEVLQIKTGVEERLQSSGKRWLDSAAPLSACAQAIAAAWTETATTGCSARGQRRRDCFLTQTRKNIGDARNWRTIALLSHRGQAWAKASVRSLVPAVATVGGPCQFGSLPGRSTRDAVAILENVFERFTNSNHQASRRSCLLAGFLFDLEEAFDTTPRDRLWAAVSDAAKLKRSVSGRMLKEPTTLAPFTMSFMWLLHQSESTQYGSENAFCQRRRFCLIRRPRPPRNLMLNHQRHESQVFIQRCLVSLSLFLLRWSGTR